MIGWSEEFRITVFIENKCELDVSYRTQWDVHSTNAEGDIQQRYVSAQQVDIMFIFTPRMLDKGPF